MRVQERRAYNGRIVYVVDAELLNAVLAIYDAGLIYEAFLSRGEGDTYIAVDNTGGEAYTETFKTEEAAMEWLTRKAMTAEEAHELDERIYNGKEE